MAEDPRLTSSQKGTSISTVGLPAFRRRWSVRIYADPLMSWSVQSAFMRHYMRAVPAHTREDPLPLPDQRSRLGSGNISVGSATTISGRRGRGKSQPGHADRPRSAGSQRVPGLRLQTRVQPQPHECASSGVRRGNPTLQHTSTSAVRTCRKQESAEDLLAPLEIDDAEGGSDKQQVPVNSTVNSSEESPEIPSVSVLGLEASEDQADLAHNSSGELRDHPHTQESQPEDKCRTAEGKVYRHVIMKPGAHVRRGPDWCHGNEDGSGEGIVVEFPVFYHPSVAKVWWNDGNTHIYRYGCDGKYDIKVITDDDDDDGEQHFL